MLTPDLTKRPAAQVRTMWFTAENPDGIPGGAGKTLFGRKGRPCVDLPAGESLTLLDVQGSGMVRRIWIVFRLTPQSLRGMKLEMTWDNAATPAVRVPIGDFFCHGGGRNATFENACFASPEGRSCVCMIPMPFRTAAKIVLVNESPAADAIFYEIDCTLGDEIASDTMYFHAHFVRENMTTLRRDFTILPKIQGCGRFLGTMVTTRIDKTTGAFWFGEGEVKLYLDGDEEYPSLCGTGTEDYIGTGYGQGVFHNQYTGCTTAEWGNLYSFYRFHIPDPVYFQKELRVTLQLLSGSNHEQLLTVLRDNPGFQIMKTGDGTEYFTIEELTSIPNRFAVTERQDDVSAVAYWYMTTPENGLPEIPDAAARLAELV